MSSQLDRVVAGYAHKLFATLVLIAPEVAADLGRWGHGGGFSLHAAVRIEADDRAGLERLLRYRMPSARLGR